ILYRSAAGSGSDELVEIHNRGSREVALEGFRLSGAVRYAFPRGARLGPGGFLAVARDPAALARAHGLAKDSVAGPFEGSLSARGEEIVLRDARGHAVDRVAYADRSPWPRGADGLGSSLELIDPFLDNSLAAAWAPSDSASLAKWQTFSFEKEHRAFKGANIAEIQFLLLAEGECLIDDVLVSGVLDESFERGAEAWRGLGTHERSGPFREGAAGGAKGQRTGRAQACYRIVADGRGNARHNYVTRDAPGLVPGRRYKVSFRAKWVRGSPLLLTRSPGQGLSKLHRLAMPERIGTPGAESSTRARPGGPPAIGTPVQEPVVPASGQPVRISARISAGGAGSGRGAPASAAIRYRPDGEASWRQAPLADDGQGPDRISGDGVWSGEIPGHPSGIIAFYIAATDAAGRQGSFPSGAPARPALYAVGISPSGKFPTYTVLVSEEEWSAFDGRPRLSNRLLDATLVYGDSRIFYNVGLRPRGSPFTRSNRNWRVVFGAETVDGRATLTLDGQGGDGTRLNERLTYWFADKLRAPTSRQQYVYFRLLGRDEGVYEDVEKVDGAYLERWFGPGEAPDAPEAGAKAKKPKAGEAKAAPARGGLLHKVDDYWELAASGYQDYIEADFAFKTPDPEEYRWNFPPRSNASREDFEPLVQLVRLLDPRATPDRGFEEKVEKTVDVDEWLKVLAARSLVDDWDTMGRTRGKNAFVYLPRAEGRWKLLVWDCDLAWRDPRSPLVSQKFPAVARLLSRPAYRRRYLGYLAYMAERLMDPRRFDEVLGDLRAYSGAATEPFREFARTRRDFVLRQVPRRPFQVTEVRRVERSGLPDLLRATGLCAPNVMRFRLAGREGSARFGADDRWIAEIPVGPEGADLKLEALDLGGDEVAVAPVKVRPRKGALPLPPEGPAVARLKKPAGEKGKEEEGARAEPRAAPGGDGGSSRGAVAALPREPSPAPERTTPEPADRREDTVDAKEEPSAPPAVGVVRAEPADEPAEPVATSFRAPELDQRPRPALGAGEPEAAEEPEEIGEEEAGAAWEIEGPAADPEWRNEGEPAGGVPWRTIAAAVLLLAAAQALLLVFVRLRRGSALRAEPTAEPRLEPGSTPGAEGLADPSFEAAAGTLEALGASGLEAVPALLDALGDDRGTPFRKIRRGPRGFSAAPTEGTPGIPVRHVASLLLEQVLGKPPVERPTRADWAARWKAIGRENP
ncbi:MAG: CotH kinase family protein, partial [Planctomycetes bacterium]|nr:CotH kinase family protein [Planctomycetota bacterium]